MYDALHDLVPFVQFKIREELKDNHKCSVRNLQLYSSMGVFHNFLNYKNGTK